MLPEQSLVWSYPKADNDENAVAFNMINSMLQRMNLSGEITKLNENQFALVKEGVECYKQIREDIKDFVPFYPIGIPKYGDGWLCLGMKSKNRKLISVWRMNSDEDKLAIDLGFDNYSAKILYPAKTKCEIEKAEKILSVCLPDKYSAVILEL